MKESPKLIILILIFVLIMPIHVYSDPGEQAFISFFKLIFILPIFVILISKTSMSLKKRYIVSKIEEVKEFYDIKWTTIIENISYIPVFGLTNKIIENNKLSITITLVIFFTISYFLNWTFYCQFQDKLSKRDIKIGAIIFSFINIFLVSTIFVIYTILSSSNTSNIF